MDYIRMLYISYGSVCELETQILLAGDLDLIEKGELSITKKDIAANRKNVKSADKVFRKQTLESLTPGILGPSSPTKLEKNQKYKSCCETDFSIAHGFKSAMMVFGLKFYTIRYIFIRYSKTNMASKRL